MMKNATKSSHTQHDGGCGCSKHSDCSGLVRNFFHAGKRMAASTLKIEQDYAASKRRLINASVLGWGIVYGYDLNIDKGGSSKGLRIGAGLAIDKKGNEVFLPEYEVLKPEDVVLLGADEKPLKPDVKLESGPYILSVHYAERYMDPVYITDDCGNERRHWERVCEGVVLALRPVGLRQAGSPEDCVLLCNCSVEPASGAHGNPAPLQPPAPPAAPAAPHPAPKATYDQVTATAKAERHVETEHEADYWKPRGGSCMCHHLAELSFETDTTCLTVVDACLHYAPHHGVDIGIVEVGNNDCGLYFVSIVDMCGVRRHVKRNDLLFDLIKGCDLTHIAKVGWSDYHRHKRRLSYTSLTHCLHSPADHDLLTFEFSKQVLIASMKNDVFVLRIWLEERDSGWLECFEAELDELRPMDPFNGYATRFSPRFDRKWIIDEIDSKRTKFNSDNVRIEIEIRGDYIVDCNGQCVDANPRGLLAAPTGNGTPGGTYLSTFMLIPPTREELQDILNKGDNK